MTTQDPPPEEHNAYDPGTCSSMTFYKGKMRHIMCEPILSGICTMRHYCLCIIGFPRQYSRILYVIQPLYDPGGLCASRAANHINIVHLGVVGDHEQEHNRFTLVQRRDNPPPTPNQRRS